MGEQGPDARERCTVASEHRPRWAASALNSSPVAPSNHGEPWLVQASGDEVVEDGTPGLGGLAADAIHGEQHLPPVLAHADDDEERDRGRLAVERHSDRPCLSRMSRTIPSSSSERAFQASEFVLDLSRHPADDVLADARGEHWPRAQWRTWRALVRDTKVEAISDIGSERAVR